MASSRVARLIALSRSQVNRYAMSGMDSKILAVSAIRSTESFMTSSISERANSPANSEHKSSTIRSI
jgi:hypothetical protein